MAKKIKLYTDDHKWAMTAFPCVIPYKDTFLWCAEQYLRLHISKDKEYRKEIIAAISFKQLTYLSSKKHMEDKGYEKDESFDKKRYKLMLKANQIKFNTTPVLMEKLKATGKAKLIYDVQYDSYFGTGKKDDGENKMGEILMQIRDEA